MNMRRSIAKRKYVVKPMQNRALRKCLFLVILSLKQRLRNRNLYMPCSRNWRKYINTYMICLEWPSAHIMAERYHLSIYIDASSKQKTRLLLIADALQTIFDILCESRWWQNCDPENVGDTITIMHCVYFDSRRSLIGWNKFHRNPFENFRKKAETNKIKDST